MAFNRPELSTIIARIKGDIEAALNLGSPALRRSNVAVFAKAFGGAAHMLHGHLDYLSRQIIIDTAEAEYLERYAVIWGLARKPADFARGSLDFTGIDGSVIPAGTILQRVDGVEYTVDDDVTVASGVASVAVTCSSSGDSGNAETGTVLTLGSPISGITSDGTVDASGLVGGIDSESDDALRDRLLTRIQNPPRGGAETDYQIWATSIEGVSRAFIFPLLLGAGTVSVYIVNDEATDPIPGSAKVAEVQAYLDDVKPVTAQVYVFAPTPVAIDPEIQIYPDTPAIRSAITEELRAYLKREAEVNGTIRRSQLSEAISGAAGEVDHVLVSPAANFTVGMGEFPVLGTVTFSTLPV